MNPLIFHIGDEVEVIGPSVGGCTDDIGHKFTIWQIHDECKFYTNGQEYNYPASSLRLVEEELKIGDWVESNGTPKRIFQIESTLFSDWSKKTYCRGAGYEYYVEDLRKLSPEEIAKHTQPDWYQCKGCLRMNQVDERLSAIEKSLQDNQKYQIIIRPSTSIKSISNDELEDLIAKSFHGGYI